MLRRASLYLLPLVAALAAAALGATPAQAQNYRGMTAGWPYYANGYYAAFTPQNQGIGPNYYVAQPAVTTASGGSLTTAMRPVTAAYANPTYFAAYGQSSPLVQPASYGGPAAGGYGYAPTTGYYPPTTGYYPPTTVQYAPMAPNYAPVSSYAVSPSGGMHAGAEAAPYYGQPQRVNYVPPQSVYRTTYAPAPVYMYRPVTAYQPVTGQPVTCLQATTTTHCQPLRRRDWSWLWPWNWFNHLHRRCGAPAPVAVPTTTYCGPTACPQPYYPAPTTVIPGTPGTIVSPPVITSPAPGTTIISPVPGSPRIPPPPTRIIPQGSTIVPADRPPSLAPGSTIISPIPGTTIPGTTIPGTTIPGTTTPGTIIQPGVTPLPGGSFPTVPPGGFGSSFPSGSNYPPLVDPYRGSSVPSPTRGSGASLRQEATDPIRAPALAPALPPNITTVPDPDAAPSRPSSNTSPPLIDPRDKLAASDPRWGVVPAVWPKQTHVAVRLSHPGVHAGSFGSGLEAASQSFDGTRSVPTTLRETKSFQPHHPPQERQPLSRSPYASAGIESPVSAAAASAAHYDDGGWTSGRSW